MNYAPILIPTLNRYNHLKRCVESLAKCTHADKTDLFIALDYPLKEEHWEGYRKIKEYVSSIEGFNTVTIIQRDHNYGPVENFSNAQNEIYEKYDRIICSEDDNEFAPNFLDYINKGLEIYYNDDDVQYICGYNYKVKIPQKYKYNTYFSNAFSAWGYGSWRHKQDRFIYDVDEIISFLKNPINAYRSAIVPFHVLLGLLAIVKTGNITGDRNAVFNNLKNNTLCLFPRLSLVRNMGHDGSGEHCYAEDYNYFAKQEINNNDIFNMYKINVKESFRIKYKLAIYNIRYSGGIRYIAKCILFYFQTIGKYIL